VVERHAAVVYHVYVLGFLPGLAYLGDVPAELALPRREVPRTRIPAGSVAIAMSISCIFPRETPCGLHLIGRSPVALWRQRSGAEFGALLAPGDRVMFAPISLREYEDLHARAAVGNLAIAPIDEARDAAA
jgi:KipI family sensor histidine kinase inhibitor